LPILTLGKLFIRAEKIITDEELQAITKTKLTELAKSCDIETNQ